MSTSGRSQAGGKPKEPDPMCPMCGSPLAKSPLGVAQHRDLQGTLTQMKQHAMQAVKRPQRPPQPRRPGYR